MNIFDQYGIREVADVTLYSIHRKKDGSGDVYYVPALYLDTLKVSSVEKTADNVWAEGGVGNARLISWDYGKQINVTLEDALCTPASLGLCWNGVLGADWKDGSVEINTDVCYCKNPVNKISRMEKAIFPRDNKEKCTVSELLPKLDEDSIDHNLDILKKSSVVDGTKIRGNGIVNGHTYRWKMAVESEVKSIAQVPDRFFDVKGRSYPIDWNRKVSVTSLPTYENYKDAIIYKINSCDQIQTPKAKIIYDESMESSRINTVYTLQSILTDDEIDIENIIITYQKATAVLDDDENYIFERDDDGKMITEEETFTLKDIIVLNRNNKKYLYVDSDLRKQFVTFINQLAYYNTRPNQYTIFINTEQLNTILLGRIKTDLSKITEQNRFIAFKWNKEDNSFSGFFDGNNEIKVESVAEMTIEELNELYNGIGTISKKDITFSIPQNWDRTTNELTYPISDIATFTIPNIIYLTANGVESILINSSFINSYKSIVDDILNAAIDGTGRVNGIIPNLFSRYFQQLEENRNRFFTYDTQPNKLGQYFGGYLKAITDNKYHDYFEEYFRSSLSNGTLVNSYLQNRATTSLFSNLKDYSLIPDELGSVETKDIPYEEIEKANYLAIIVDINNDYHALIGVTKKDSTYLNTSYDDTLNPITWYKPKTSINVNQFKGLDMWLRFQSINEMTYFLITKYENDIEDILPSYVDANEYKTLWGGGNGNWAVNKQGTIVRQNEDSESIKKQGKLWAYVNPRTMQPYDDDYWFHQGEPIYIKSLTIAPKGKKIKANRITVKADQWPGMYMMVGETYIRSRDTGEDERMQIKFPLCKVKSDQTITLEAGGDPTTFNLDLEIARPASGTMMELTSYEIAQKLYEGDNGCFYAVDGSTEVLSE